MGIVVDRERCLGSGQCMLIEPRVFGQDDQDGRVLLRADRPAPDTTEEAREAVEACPSGALSLAEERAAEEPAEE